MSKKLLELNGKDSLEISKQHLDQFPSRYDFSNNKLVYGDSIGKKKMSTYIISKELVNAVNAAIVTGRPLLLKGEPGCGKTKIAKAVAYYLHQEEAEKYYFEWFVKSKSTAREGGYQFDHIRRLRDATVAAKDDDARSRVQNPDNYLKLGSLGKALVSSPSIETPSVLLIDEIDKGDIDFPNDLLLELDEMRFSIDEKSNTFISAEKGKKPLVFITSNDERELPPAFIRRCLFYRIPPFSSDLLELIATKKSEEFYEDLDIAGGNFLKENDIKNLVAKFQDLKSNSVNTKPPSTSELLDWIKLIIFKLNNSDKKLEDFIEDEQLQSLALKLM